MLCAPGPERHSEEPAVGVVLCRPPPPGEDHLAVALRDPAEDQPVRAAAVLSQSLTPVPHPETSPCMKMWAVP